MRSGFKFDLDCVFKETVCLDEDETYCGLPLFDTKLYRRSVNSVTSLTFDAEPIKVGAFGSSPIDPEPIKVEITHTKPIRISNPIEFQSCEAFLGTDKCESCVICENKKQVKFSCSNVNLATAGSAPYYAPAFNQCLGISDKEEE